VASTDVVGIGNAIVDVITRANDADIESSAVAAARLSAR
jgi:hypothetical protein